MKFVVAKREVDIRWAHVWFVIGVIFAIMAAFFIIGGAIAGLISLTTGIAFMDSYLQTLAIAGLLASLVTPPLTAFVYVSAMPYFKMKKEVASCRATAAVQFIIMSAIILVLLTFSGIMGSLTLASWALVTAEWLATYAAGTISLYLWMLIFLKNDMDGLKRTSLPAVLAAVAITAVSIIAPYAIAELFGMGTIPIIGISTLIPIISNLWFALPLIMFMPKKPDDAAYLYAGLFLCGTVLGTLSPLLMPGGGIVNIALGIINGIAMLGIVFIAGTYGRKT